MTLTSLTSLTLSLGHTLQMQQIRIRLYGDPVRWSAVARPGQGLIFFVQYLRAGGLYKDLLRDNGRFISHEMLNMMLYAVASTAYRTSELPTCHICPHVSFAVKEAPSCGASQDSATRRGR